MQSLIVVGKCFNKVSNDTQLMEVIHHDTHRVAIRGCNIRVDLVVTIVAVSS